MSLVLEQMHKQAVEYLAGQCICVLDQGTELIKKLEDIQFTTCAQNESGSVGSHFRHVIEFVKQFLTGVENGRIDYNLRERNLVIEKNRESAIDALNSLIGALENLKEREFDGGLLLHLERGNFVSEENAWCETSLLRELEFVQSHTLHHFALIGLKLQGLGIPLPENFGVAPSTLDFWKSQKRLTVVG